MRGFLSAVVLGLSMFTGGAQAALVVGNTYHDSNNISWTYVGDYNVGAGPAWQTDPANYSALQAAGIVFGTAAAGYEYAISTLDTIVNHLAWYDGYGDGSHLPLTNSYGGGVALAEGFFSDVGAPGYNTGGDFSAYVGSDRAELGGGAFNHVFITAAANHVPEPGSLALLGLGLAAIAVMRKRKI